MLAGSSYLPPVIRHEELKQSCLGDNVAITEKFANLP